MSKRRRSKYLGPRIKVGEQFVAHPVAMLKSAAFRSLKLSDRKILDRLEIENASHAGKRNGELICTYMDFQKHGVRRASIPGAIKRLVQGGFLVVTEQGRQSYGDLRIPSRYRLTYLHTFGNGRWIDPTHDWRLLEKQKAGRENAPRTGRENAARNPDFPDAKTKLHRQKPDAESRLLSRSRGGGVGVCGTEDISSAARQYQSPLPARGEVDVPPPSSGDRVRSLPDGYEDTPCEPQIGPTDATLDSQCPDASVRLQNPQRETP
jgi:hypothetical protein